MSRLLLAFGAAVMLAAPAAAGTILYATAASQRRVDSFCLGPNGGLAGKPRQQVQTGGHRPRRVVVSPDNKFLFVAQRDRVEIYAIGSKGDLERVGRVPQDTRKMSPHDIALGFDGRVLYVPDRVFGNVDAYDLSSLYPDDPAVPPQVPSSAFSCIQGHLGAGWENLIVRNDLPQPLLYISNSDNRGAVSTFPLTDTGAFVRLCVDPQTGEVLRDPVTGKALECGVWGLDGCGDDASVTPPSSRRKRLSGAQAMVFDGNRIYVEARYAKQLSGFDLLPDGTFDDQLPNGKQRQKRATKTKKGIRYVALVMANRTLLLSQFVDGRIDSYRLRSNNKLPKEPTEKTKEDVRTSPVRMAVHDNVLYVAAGEADRIQAYRLFDEGQTRDRYPFSQTDFLRGSFPNDVAIATIPDACN
jgi:6-phosphogluconolactonase (cycloisomerase 2 family)